MFSNKDIAAYYDTTQNHYEKWWNLKQTQALHYGIWDNNTKNFTEALLNTNKVLIETAQINESDYVLDAGCGIGGSSVYIAKNTGARVKGISLSKKQVLQASNFAKGNELTKLISFETMDFIKTSFADETFDVIWACESVCHANNKHEFLKEAFRILKKGGRIILADFFLTNQNQIDDEQWIKKWCNTWSVPGLVSSNYFIKNSKDVGFISTEEFDYTNQIRKTAKRMYIASILGTIPSETYNLFHPKVSHFAKSHYKCGYYQYKALKAKLWKYKVIVATK